MTATETAIRSGDSVFHKPTGERWTVAYADHDTGDMSWSGWPEGSAKLEDCELVDSCSDEEHRRHVQQWLDSRGDSSRKHNVRRLYVPGWEQWSRARRGVISYVKERSDRIVAEWDENNPEPTL